MIAVCFQTTVGTGATLTPDLGGTATTAQVGDAIVAALSSTERGATGG